MNYTTYEFYSETYLGEKIPQENFEKLSLRASAEVRKNIYDRDISEYDKDVQMATCSVAELLYEQQEIKDKIQDENNKEVASETVGPHSKSYVNKSSLLDKRILSSDEMSKNVYNECLKYLAFTGLMYRGGD